MAKRRRIGIFYSYDENWIGGVYYISNLIKCLNLLKEELRPELFIYTSDEATYNKLKVDVKYPYLNFCNQNFKYTLVQRALNYLSRKTIKKNIFEQRYTHKEIDLLFPARDYYEFELIKNKAYWIPDFQELHFPDFFSKTEIESRNKVYNLLVKNNKTIVFSSENAKSDFRRLFPNATNKTRILQFAVKHNLNNLPEEKFVTHKFAVKKPFFIVSNQFWKHKNHNLIIEALALLKRGGRELPFSIVFTGKEIDTRDPNAFGNLKMKITEFKLDGDIHFLGFIDRNEQLALMKASLAVIQPSLFEGWSTVIEDAKSLGKWIFASNIAVHREQLRQNYTFFDPYSPEELGKIIDDFICNEYKPIPLNYEINQLKFAENFLTL